jgi:hypothetical protein
VGASTPHTRHGRRQTGGRHRHPLRRQLRRQARHEPGDRREQSVRGQPGPVPAPSDDPPRNPWCAARPRRARVRHLHRQRRDRGLARRGPAAAHRGPRWGLHVRAAGDPASPGEPQRRHDRGRGRPHRPPGAGERGPHDPAAAPRRAQRHPRRQPAGGERGGWHPPVIGGLRGVVPPGQHSAPAPLPRLRAPHPPQRPTRGRRRCPQQGRARCMSGLSRRTPPAGGTRRPGSGHRRPGRCAAPAASTWPGGPARPDRPRPRRRTGASTPPR